MFSKRTLAPRRKPRLSSSIPCSTACLFPFAPCRSTAARSSLLTLNRLASSAICTSSYFPRALQTQWCRRTRQPHPCRGVLPGHALLAGNETTQSRTTPVGRHLQHPPPSPGARLLTPHQFLRLGPISANKNPAGVLWEITGQSLSVFDATTLRIYHSVLPTLPHPCESGHGEWQGVRWDKEQRASVRIALAGC